MTKVLGLDLGTNSIGWAVVEESENGYRLLDQGVDIFQEGVARDKNNEKPAVQDRTTARASRRHYFRRRLRKIALLKVLIAHDLCPPLSDEQLQAWRTRQIYPLTEAFLQWQRTDDNRDKNPYHDRYRALTERLDLNLQSDRYALGRALYHLAQRRGFLSNRKEAGNEKEDGQVKSSIKELTVQMHDAGCRYLGEYFYKLYQRKEKIRNHYTARNEHYLAEFQAICDRQQLPETWVAALKKAIFFQRPLKSQKGQVGHCTFERRKSRCPLSHPRYEEFRMLAFINNIRVTTPQDDQPRPLNDAEVAAIRPLFLRKSKPHFDFEEIARKIAGKGMYACKDDRNEAPYGFNFSRTATVSGCPVTAALASLFGDEWLTTIASHYTLADAKNEEQILNDIWHALFFFDDEERLQAWAAEKLQLSAAEAATFAAIRLPQGYASLSLNAISKILPYLRRGYRYDEAVFLANLKAVLPATLYADPQKRQTIEAEIAAIIDDYRSDPLNRHLTKEQCVKDYLQNTWDIDFPCLIYEKRHGSSAGLCLFSTARERSVIIQTIFTNEIKKRKTGCEDERATWSIIHHFPYLTIKLMKFINIILCILPISICVICINGGHKVLKRRYDSNLIDRTCPDMLIDSVIYMVMVILHMLHAILCFLSKKPHMLSKSE